MSEIARDHLFLSHARPEDDEFTLWLALQLAKRGYAVWCDLTQLLGGEKFYIDIEQTIRNRTAKFLYVLTRISNEKPGVRQELITADTTQRKENLEDFIIPLHLDDLPRPDMNMMVSGLNSIPFDKSWAEGLSQLLLKLERDNVPKHPKFSPDSVAEWWKTHHSANEGVLREPEACFSNLFPIEELPPRIFFHALDSNERVRNIKTTRLPYPAVLHESYIVTFAPREDFGDKIGPAPTIDHSQSYDTLNFLDGTAKCEWIKSKERRDLIYKLLRRAWEFLLNFRNLSVHDMANNTSCFYFVKDVVQNDTIRFSGVTGKTNSRAVVGYKTIRNIKKEETKRFWHFGFQAKPYIEYIAPTFAYYIKPHVLFSDDGKTIWDNDKRLHMARRGQCKHWWNADWRDRIFASMTWLADEEGNIKIQMSKTFSMCVASRPIEFISPVRNAGVDAEPADEDIEAGDEMEEEEEI